MHALLADAILITHALFIIFVIVGFILILWGGIGGWSWIRNFLFRLMHLLAIGIVAVQAWCEKVCPLTLWENRFREAAGGNSYTATFMQHWLHKLIFYDFPPWVFTVVYTVFGAFVLATWILWPPKKFPSKN
jgi:hypothetical protein